MALSFEFQPALLTLCKSVPVSVFTFGGLGGGEVNKCLEVESTEAVEYISCSKCVFSIAEFNSSWHFI